MVRRPVAIGVAGLLVLGGCVTPPRPFTDEFYAPMRVRGAAVSATPVAVFGFADERPGDDPTVVLRYEPLDGAARVERGTVPVSQGVARAFARGLSARGYTVTDATARQFTPGDAAPAPIVVTGRVSDFGVRIARSGLVTGWESRAGCRVTVEVWEAATRRRVSERMYQSIVQGAMRPAEPMTILSQVLATVVAQAVEDPELQAVLRPR